MNIQDNYYKKSPAFGASFNIPLELVGKADKRLANMAALDVPNAVRPRLSNRLSLIKDAFFRKTPEYNYAVNASESTYLSMLKLSIADDKGRTCDQDLNGQEVRIAIKTLVGDNGVEALMEKFDRLRKAMEEHPVRRWLRQHFEEQRP